MKLTTKITFNFSDVNVDASLITIDNFIDFSKAKENKKSSVEIYKKKNKNTLF